MNKKNIILWGIVLLILLALLCILTHARKIENKLTATAQEQLQAANLEGVTVSFDGRTAILSGETTSPEMMDKAEALLRSINGVRTVKNQLTLADVTAEAPEAATEAPETSTVAAPVQTPKPAAPKVDLSGFYINFETNSYHLSNSSTSTQNHLHKILTENTDLRIKTLGHTDSRGTEAYNMALSIKRAKSVKSALVKKGILPERISAIGKGETHPIADNSTAAGRRKNRRVEFIIAEEK